jgi:crotonobetainyl-CoA:carnitine CoA-transferase CaiB-like acyl-CoA transferase
VLVENYSPRVFESFGFDREGIEALNPGIVFVRMPAFGLDGPWRNHVGFAQTMEQVTGLAWITGPPGQPTIPRGPCDPAAGYHAFFAALAALHRREATGRGAFIESAMCEAVVAIGAEMTVEYSASGTVLASMGNRGPDAAPQGLYRCRGFDEWVAVAVETDTQWEALVEALGRPAWAFDAAYSTGEGRRAAHDVLDREIGRWALDQDSREAADGLVACGVPAGRVIDPRLAPWHPQFRALGYFEEMRHAVAGTVTVAPMPFRYDSVTSWIRTPSPALGQHNEEVLSEVLHLTADQIERLVADQVIGNRPLNV